MSLGLAPGKGGAIAYWRHGQSDLLRSIRPCPDGVATVREYASFPLIPFSNRIGRGIFGFAGARFALPRDARDTRHAMHGNALYAVWDLVEQSPAQARLRLCYRPGMDGVPWFPFAYEAMQIYTLTSAGLTIELSIRNDDERPFPAGLGHHLYFPRHNGAMLQFEARGYWTNGPDGLPEAAENAGELFAAGASVGACQFDNCFFGWHGTAKITYPRLGDTLYLSAGPGLNHVVLFVPSGQDFFAFEPVSHSNDAINRIPPGAHGAMQVLAPGEVKSTWIGIEYTQS